MCLRSVVEHRAERSLMDGYGEMRDTSCLHTYSSSSNEKHSHCHVLFLVLNRLKVIFYLML